MSTAAVELNDAGLILATEQGVAVESPGYAIYSGKHLVTGEEAWREGCRRPRQLNSRFWERLGTESLEHAVGPARSYADLAYVHLQSIWQRFGAGVERVIVAVPGLYTREQLGLLLGMSQQLSIPVAMIVDAAVAAVPQPYPVERLLHVELHLHRAVLSVLVQGPRLRRSDLETIPDAGSAEFQQSLVAGVAQAFIRATRFDPLHRAEAEEQLYQRLAQMQIGLTRNESFELELCAGARAHRVAFTRAQALRSISPLLRRIREAIQNRAHNGSDAVVLVGHRLAAVVGAIEYLAEESTCRVVALAHAASALGALHLDHGMSRADGGVGFISDIPWTGGPESGCPQETVRATESGERMPTHVLHREIAYPIGARPLRVGRFTAQEQESQTIDLSDHPTGVSRLHCEITRRGGTVVLDDRSRYGTLLNGVRVQGAAVLRTGDVVGIGSPGEELRAIEVVKADEAQSG